MTNQWTAEPIIVRPATINGVAVPVGTNFVDAVSQVARNTSVISFRVKVGGVEVGPANAPATITEGMVVTLEPYDKAGTSI